MNGSLPPANPSPAQKGGQKERFWLRPLLVPGSEMENGKTPLRAVAPSLISVLEAKGRGCLLARVLFSASHRGPCWTASPPARAEPNFDRFSALGSERSFPFPPRPAKLGQSPHSPRSGASPGAPAPPRLPAQPAALTQHEAEEAARQQGHGRQRGARLPPRRELPRDRARPRCSFRVNRNQTSSHSSTCSPAAAPRESLCYGHPSPSSQQHAALCKASRPSNRTIRERRGQRAPLAAR